MAEELGPLEGLGLTEGVVQLFLWQVVGQVLGAALTPLTSEIQQFFYSHFPDQPLSPEQLADMVVRSVRSLGSARDEAKLSGIDEQRFEDLVHNTGEPPGLEMLLEAFRRGFIAESGTGSNATSLEQGIRESRLKDKWIPTIKQLGLRPLTPATAVDAVVENQISYELGEHVAYLNGISSDDFRVMVNTRGNPPSPTELNVLHKRGLIPLEGTGPDATSVQQGIFEGATKDKWWKLLAALADYIPPPRTVTALVREGALTDAEAIKEFQNSGLSEHLAAAYLTAAHHQKTQKERDLTKDDIVKLYGDRIFTAAQATDGLKMLGYNDASAGFLLAAEDFHRNSQQLNALVSRIRTFYIGRRLDATSARAALIKLQVGEDAAAQLLTEWSVVRASNVKTLTEAQVAAAFHSQIIDQETATQELLAMGYDPWTAWVELSTREHKKLPGEPPRGPTPIE